MYCSDSWMCFDNYRSKPIVSFTSVPFTFEALQRVRNSFSRFLQSFLPSEGTWVMFAHILRGRGHCRTQPQWRGPIYVLLYWSHVPTLTEHPKCISSMLGAIEQGMHKHNWCCWLRKYPYKLQTQLPACFYWRPGYTPESSPYFLRALSDLQETELGLFHFCTSVIRGKAIFLKICLKGNELIISHLRTVIMNLLPLSLIEIPEGMSN